MAATFNCPTCGAPLHTDGSETNINCEYCGASVIVPAELRASPAAQPAQAAQSVPYTPMPSLQIDDPAQRRMLLRQVMQLVREGRTDEATAQLSSITGTPPETIRPMVDRISMALGSSGRINPLELMAILSQISPGEDFWNPSQPSNVVSRPYAGRTYRRRGGGVGCLILIFVGVVLYVTSNSPAHILNQVMGVFNQFLRLLH